jgi:pimeloyl-ACP methyl ester carboxylesterase
MTWVKDIGAGARSILFIHGHPFNRSMWQPQVDALRDRYRLIVPDLRGYGDSPASPDAPVTQEQFATDLVEILDERNVPKAVVVGLSMGGQIAMEFGRRFPDRVDGLVLAATFAEAETQEGVADRFRIAERMEREGMAVIGCEILPRLIGKTSMAARPQLAAFVYGMICDTCPKSAAAAVRGRALRKDYRNTLRGFTFPSLVVIGDEDSYTSVAQGQAMQALIPQCALHVFPRVGHLPNLEQPLRFNASLDEFIASLN